MKKEKNTNEKGLYNVLSTRLFKASAMSTEGLLKDGNSSIDQGLNEETVEESRDKFGANVLETNHKKIAIQKFFEAFVNPFSLVLLVLALVSLISDVIIPANKDPSKVIVITSLVLLSSLSRFLTEEKSSKAIAKLTEMVETTASVTRSGVKREIPLDEIVVGDIVHLGNGDFIPADVRLLECKDFFVSQSSLTGESDSIEKNAVPIPEDLKGAITDRSNLAFMGSTVISGAATAIVIDVGSLTYFGQIASKLTKKRSKSAFNKGIDSVSWLLVRFVLVLAPVIFFINGFTKNDWLSSFLFAISVAVGLTPEMLPMIVTSCLAKGAIAMSKKKVIIKSIDSIQDFGAIDILCTDKTGTLTKDQVALEDHLNVSGSRDLRVLRHAFLNSYFQTGLKNLMDQSIIDKARELKTQYPSLDGLETAFAKIDEIPFDFERKRMSVVVKDKAGKTQLITKGAVEEILSICTFAEQDGVVSPLSDEMRNGILNHVKELSMSGLRVIAVAQKNNPAPIGAFSVQDESDMVLIGYLTFYDPPKESASDAIASLNKYGVKTKILTGDNAEVSLSVASKVGIPSNQVLLGSEIDAMSEDDLRAKAESVYVFAKLSPENKSRVIEALKANGHVVGYLGDGINDAPALKSADIAISVDSAADIAKESAHVILLEKDLRVLEDGIIEGRRTYGNMIKYIKMTASSNYGNIFSEIIAAIFLPFLPMLPIHLLLLNLISDFACATLPWDNVDDDFLIKPRKWDASSIGRFMMIFGPISSLFDWVTYAMMFFVFCPMFAGGAYWASGTDKVLFASIFQTGWFVESMWTQIFVILLLRSKHFPFVKNLPSPALLISASLGVLVVTVLPYTPLSTYLGLSPLGWQFYLFLLLTVLSYMALTSLVKFLYMRKRGGVLY